MNNIIVDLMILVYTSILAIIMFYYTLYECIISYKEDYWYNYSPKCDFWVVVEDTFVEFNFETKYNKKYTPHKKSIIEAIKSLNDVDLKLFKDACYHQGLLKRLNKYL